MSWFRNRGVAFFVLTLLAGNEVPGRCVSTVEEIVGTWRGSSVCVDREAAPACKDEQVVYEIAVTPGKSNTVTVKADKVVGGERVPMGVLDFTCDGKDVGWTTEIETPRVQGKWRLTVSGKKMQGTMTLLPSKAVVRKMDLRKDE